MYVPVSRYRELLGRYLAPQRGQVALLALMLFCGIGLQLLNPQIIRYFLDSAQTGVADAALLLASALFIVAALAQRGLALGALALGERVGWAATNALRANLALHCLRLDLPFHKRRTPGELIERVDGDVTALGDFFSQFAIQMVGNLLLIAAILLLLAFEDWRVGLGLALYTVAAFAALGAVQNLGVARWSAYRQAEAEQFGFLEERIAGTEDIRASGAEAHTLARLERITADLLAKNRSARLVSNLTFASTNFLFVLGYGLGLGVGAYLYTQGSVTIGTAFLIVAYIGMLATPLERIRQQVQDLQQAAAGIGRVSELFAVRPAVTERASAALPAGALALAFEGVSFGYHDEDQPADTGDDAALENSAGALAAATALVLRDVSFRLKPGAVLGLLGRTGSGKTTLTRLIFRLYDMDAGAIRLGGVDIRDVAFADLRARVGMVTQDVQLFQASIRENLALFDPTIDDGRIERALAELGLLEWLRALPDGLDTKLGAGGLGLSAGEAQLLAFARVFLRDPGLVILDEASSRLDPATERLLERAIDRLLAGRTAIVIAHRLGTVRRADEILILEGGQVVEHGPRERLAADPGARFARLLQTGMEEVLA